MSQGAAITLVDPVARNEELFAGWIAVTREAITACERGDHEVLAQTLEARAAIAREVDEMCGALRRTLDSAPATADTSRLRNTLLEAAELERQISHLTATRCTALWHAVQQQQRGIAAVHAYTRERGATRTLDRRT